MARPRIYCRQCREPVWDEVAGLCELHAVAIVGTTPPAYATGEPTAENRKAEDWQQEDPALPWQNDVRCRNCNEAMWVREPLRHDICEECGYTLRDQMQQIATQQRQHVTDRLVNPFDD